MKDFHLLSWTIESVTMVKFVFINSSSPYRCFFFVFLCLTILYYWLVHIDCMRRTSSPSFSLSLSLSLVFFILFIRYSALFFFSHWILLALCFDWFLLQTFSDAKTIYRYLVIFLSSRYMWILFTIHTDI